MNRRHAIVETPVDALLLVADGDALTGLYFQGYRYTPPASAQGPLVRASEDPALAQAERELGEYFAGTRHDFDIPAVTSGDPFQERVWAQLRQIPHGTTITYGDVAIALGDKVLAQSVGQAVGRNPVSIVIPCHRVLGAGGKLTGFGGGLKRKQFLLDLEEPASIRATRLF
ncbi:MULTISPECIES: methylated-DNA--[protein]-cysteine S-methyltransferase [Arthrobacter]|uniref:Methylated-DNA--protein-cysteine methyltransferase n=2 Tax=Arthrobacter TaxID=1663 RepID=A0ABU9KNV8_9MICC|nr:methylated-DNA--[protein]-cysteine S-methyltransferase [Arthrobacter sp. YJM1]MDP5228610.1 methylated-DNA--[protein]-cysteine S-methyltransferase [Arthrobacter sp. YJM1]